MKVSKLLMFGLLGCAMVPLGGCTSVRVPVPDLGALVPVGLTGYRTKVVDVRNSQERAADCVAQFEPDGKAPQVMTYDSNTKTEVHMNTDGRNVDVTAQNKTNNTAMGMGGKVGGMIPEACTDADPLSGPASSKKHNYDTSWNNH